MGRASLAGECPEAVVSEEDALVGGDDERPGRVAVLDGEFAGRESARAFAIGVRMPQSEVQATLPLFSRTRNVLRTVMCSPSTSTQTENQACPKTPHSA